MATVLSLAGSRHAQALSITAVYDSSITSDANAATIEASIQSTIATYETMFLDPINVTITFSEMSSGLGESTKGLTTDSYTDFLSKLTASKTSTSDQTALNSLLPSGSTNPVNGNANMEMSVANAEALGIFTGSNTTSASIQLNTSIMNLSRSGTQNGSKYDLVSTVEHEMDEVLGLGSALVNGSNGNAAPTTAVMPEDLFRYSSTAGTRSFTTSASAAAYFSIDGGHTDIAQFNQQSDSNAEGDFGDWYSYQVAHTPQVQDAFGTPGVILNVGTSEKTALDVIGYTLLSSFTWNPTVSTTGTPPDGGGTWTNGSGTWWNGTANSTWSNANVQNAQFGTAGTLSTTAYTVTLGSAITVGELVFGNANYTINGGGNSLTIDGGIIAAASATINAPIILGANNTWEADGAATLTVAGNVSGGFGITKQGMSTLILSGTNSYTGGTTVSSGTLQVGSAGALPSGKDVVMNGGTLDIDGQAPSIGNLTFGDGVTAVMGSVIDSAATKGSLTLNGNITYTGTLNGSSYYFDPGTIAANLTLAAGTHHITTADTSIAANYDIVISGNVSGPGGISKDGVDYLALTGTNTYSGATAITGGWVFTAATNTLSPNSAVTISSGAVLSLNANNTQTGITTGNYNQIIGSLAGAGQVLLGTATLTVGADNTSTSFSGSIFDANTSGGSGSGGLTKTGTGIFSIISSQSYTGLTTINGGTLQLGDGTSGDDGFVSGSSGVTGTSSGTLAFDYTANYAISLAIGGAVNILQTSPSGKFVFLTGNNTYTGTTTINSGTGVSVGAGGTTGSLGTGNTINNGTIQFDRTNSLVVSSAISGSGSVLVIAGGTIILTGANSYQGSTSIQSNSTLQLGNGGTSGSLSSSTTVSGNAGNTFAFNRTDSFTVGSAISGGLTVAQNGTGVTILSATSASFTGPTQVNAGALLVSGSISGSTVAVNSGGTLEGNGTTGAVNVASGGTVLPVSTTAPSLLSTKSDTFASGSHFVLELGGTTGTNTSGVAYSELKVTGSVSLAGDIQVTLFGSYVPHVNDTFYIILNDGTDPIGGTGFSNVSGNTFTSDGITFQVNYAANGDVGMTGNDVSITVLSGIPEPASWPLLFSGGVMLLGCRRRWRKS